MSPRFRTIYVQEPSPKKDYGPLKEYATDIVFMLSGMEEHYTVEQKLRDELEEFDPVFDAVIPVGRVIEAFILGKVLRSRCQGRLVCMGIYFDKDYTFMWI
jgi:hypothetical protein